MRKGVQGVRVYRKSKTAQKNHSLRKEPAPRGATTNSDKRRTSHAFNSRVKFGTCEIRRLN